MKIKFSLFLLIVLISGLNVLFAQNFQIPQYRKKTEKKEILNTNSNYFDASLDLTKLKNKYKNQYAENLPQKGIDSLVNNLSYEISNLYYNRSESNKLDSAVVNDSTKKKKVRNTFLSETGKPDPFFILDSKNYSIDDINYFLSGQTKAASFQNITLQNFSETSVVSAELGTFFFGPVRLGVNGSFSTKSDSTKDNAIKTSLQKIFSNGGALGLNFSLPILLTRDKIDQVHFGIFAQTGFGLNPGFDSSTKNTNFSNNLLFTNQTGFNFHFDVGSNDKKARLFFDIPAYYCWGSKKTYSSLGINDYSVIKLQVGASLGDLVNFKISGPVISSSKTMQELPYIISFSFSPFNLGKE